MARPRTFDEDRALDAALETFWSLGYEAASTDDLCTATGLGRSSLYNTFRSKHALFLRALDRYTARMNERSRALLEDETRPVPERIAALLARFTEEPEPGVPPGCMVVNTAVELSGRDPEIGDRLERDYQERHAMLTTALAAGQRAGEIDREKDPRALAHFLIATMSGMRVTARSALPGSRARLEATAASALAAL
ncbi:TetR/AcrR family transcriptional regulator [Streptomyces carpaticus]|uniref:TetR/AcrR family transcriptional regulator n=1 Tax=Streptomyces carpaticus TaxID=285558 RepID=A0ABV4ZT68_9ACTN